MRSALPRNASTLSEIGLSGTAHDETPSIRSAERDEETTIAEELDELGRFHRWRMPGGARPSELQAPSSCRRLKWVEALDPRESNSSVRSSTMDAPCVNAATIGGAVEDLTLAILKEIRDDLRDVKVSGRETVARLDTTVERLDTTVERLDTTVERLDRLERRQVETEVRLATELVSVVGAINSLRTTILEDRALRHTVDDHEARLQALESKRIA